MANLDLSFGGHHFDHKQCMAGNMNPCERPCNIRNDMIQTGPIFSASGINKLNKAHRPIPPPKKNLPPYFDVTNALLIF